MLLSDDGNGGKPQSQEDRLANISMQRPRRPLDSLVSLSRESKRSSHKGFSARSWARTSTSVPVQVLVVAMVVVVVSSINAIASVGVLVTFLGTM